VRRLYQMLLRLYPREHRAEFGDEMLSVFAQAAADRRTQGWFVCVRFLFYESSGALVSACAEWLRRTRLLPPLGAIVLAATLHTVFYTASSKVSRTVSAVAQRSGIPLAEPRAAALLMGLLGVISLLCLLPLFFLLSIRLMRRSR
jgi:hypothetical protein